MTVISNGYHCLPLLSSAVKAEPDFKLDGPLLLKRVGLVAIISLAVFAALFLAGTSCPLIFLAIPLIGVLDYWKSQQAIATAMTARLGEDKSIDFTEAQIRQMIQKPEVLKASYTENHSLEVGMKKDIASNLIKFIKGTVYFYEELAMNNQKTAEAIKMIENVFLSLEILLSETNLNDLICNYANEGIGMQMLEKALSLEKKDQADLLQLLIKHGLTPEKLEDRAHFKLFYETSVEHLEMLYEMGFKINEKFKGQTALTARVVEFCESLKEPDHKRVPDVNLMNRILFLVVREGIDKGEAIEIAKSTGNVAANFLKLLLSPTEEVIEKIVYINELNKSEQINERKLRWEKFRELFYCPSNN